MQRGCLASLLGCHVEKFEDKSDAVFDITEKFHNQVEETLRTQLAPQTPETNFRNLFNKPAGMNSSVVPLSQGQVIVSIPSGATVSASGTTSTVSPSSMSSSAAAGLQRLAAQSQQVTFARPVVKLRCQHCNRLFATKPELLDYKGKMFQFCGKTCCDDYKKRSSMMALCEYCRIEKIIKETVRFSGIDKTFCSEGAVPTVTAKIIGDRVVHLVALVADQGSTYSGDLESEAVSTPHSWEEELNHYALRSNTLPEPEPELKQFSKGDVEQDLEADFPSGPYNVEKNVLLYENSFDPLSKGLGVHSRSRARRRHRDGFPQPKRRGRKKSVVSVEPRNLMQGSYPGCSVSGMTLKYMYGVNAWKNWVQWKNAQEEQGDLKFSVRPVKLKEDILSCTFAELSFGLCQFIQEVRRPNGEKYDPDSILYLCLGIQQYLFENGRIDNIFTEPYSRFMIELTKLLKIWEPTILPNGYMFSRIEEEHLWECKQLGAYSPIVLLNTLLFFNTKYFQLKNVSEHLKLSFAHVMRRTRTLKYNTKMTYLRFFPPFQKQEVESDKLSVGKRKRSEDEEIATAVEMAENTDNPLRCPVRLYEFYLSKCSESVKQRSDVFYLQPERSCVPNSPMWYSTLPIDPGTLDIMLTRILMVREIHEELAKVKSEDSDIELSD
ncbi:zinc finger mym-type protein 4 isoform x5 [Limosa lapponica baueri]|uniref:Zinc finger mym-type protein 4 isoform x5 n=1 Tax=Limosa lapponica baueri TaxID=1758121 RepID=A0A2I0TQT2_LIMLA|nr:zinc finger mym-type protein 4 isoform x5 [Limosa lapponica baueri]